MRLTEQGATEQLRPFSAQTDLRYEVLRQTASIHCPIVGSDWYGVVIAKTNALLSCLECASAPTHVLVYVVNE